MSNEAALYGLTYEVGLHVLKDEWCQKSYIGAQSRYLTKHLADVIAATHSVAPERKRDFNLNGSPTGNIAPTSRERIWERSIFLKWERNDAYSIPGCWHRTVSFQVPLRSVQTDASWGDVDLLGVAKTGIPVVIELKKDPHPHNGGQTENSESPMRMVLQGVAYAIAIKKSWPHMREEFATRVTQIVGDPFPPPPDVLTTVPIVAAAPAAFWIDWLPVTGKGRSEIMTQDWEDFSKLLNALKSAGFPVSFLSISGDANEPETLAAQPLTNFPLICLP